MTPEFRFVAACCRWPGDDYRKTQVEALARQVGSWKEVVRLTLEHRVEGLVWSAVKSAAVIPGGTLGQFERMAERVRIDSIKGVAEALRICGRLSDANIDFRVFKGLPIAVLAYGSVSVKNSVDLDLLVRPADAVRTAQLLEAAGYRQMRPWRKLDHREFASWSSVAKEAWFVGAEGQVDLHWDLLDQPALLQGVDAWESPRPVPILGSRSLPSLPDVVHLAYLAGHGALSGWSRLKWIADFAAMIRAQPAEDRAALCDEARLLAGSRPIDQGLVLAERLLGPGLPPPSPGERRRAEALASLALAIIARRGATPVFEHDRKAQRLLSRSQWQLGAGMGFQMQEVRRRLRDEQLRFRLRWPLPRPLHGLYAVLSVPGIGIGVLARAIRAARS
jgi:hypothetical protein